MAVGRDAGFPHSRQGREVRDFVNMASDKVKVIEEKVARGDYIIPTDGTLADTDMQVKKVYELLMADC